MNRRAVIGIKDMAGRAAARAVVAGVVVGAQEVQSRVEEPRLGQADEDGIGAVLGAQPADAEAGARLAVIFFALGDANIYAEPSPTLEDAQNVAGLAHLKARQGIEKRHD